MYYKFILRLIEMSGLYKSGSPSADCISGHAAHSQQLLSSLKIGKPIRL